MRAYRVFHDSLVDYLEGGESNMYRAVTGAVTVEFAAMSAVMTACREALVGGPEGGPLAAAVDQMQQLEKQKLQLVRRARSPRPTLSSGHLTCPAQTALLHEARVAYAMRRRGEAGAGALVSAAPGAGEGEGADAHYTGEGAGTRCREDATAERNELIVGAVDALCGAALGEGYTGTLLELGRPPQPPRVPEQTSCLWGVWEDPTVARVEADVERIEAQVREVMEEVRAELASLAE